MLIAAFAANALLNYAFSVALSWLLGPAEFGMLGVAQSLLLLSGLVAGSGFTWTVAQDIAAWGVGEDTRRRFRTGWAANTGLGLLLAAGLGLAYASRLLPLGRDYLWIVLLAGLTTVLLAMRSVLNGAMRGLFWFGRLAANLTGEVAIKLAVGLALVAGGYGVRGVMIGFACGALAALLHSLWLLRPARLFSGGGRFEPGVLWATAPLFVAMIGPSLILNLDILGLKMFAPAAEGDHLAGLYQAAVILARTPVFIAQSLGMVFFSYAAGSAGAGSPGAGELREIPPYIRAAARAWARLLLPVALALILAPQAALKVFYPDLYHSTAVALQLAAAGGALLALAVLFTTTLQAAGVRSWPAIVTGAAVLCQTAILKFGIPAWGITAAAASLLGGGLVALLGLLPAVAAVYRPALPSPGRAGWLPLVRLAIRAGLPFFFLVAPLLVLPGGGRLAEMFRLFVAGMGYCLALLVAHPPRAAPAGRPVRRQIAQLVNVLLGG